jgi:excisionase family DNA binding protein
MRAEKIHKGIENMPTITESLLTRKQVAAIFQVSPPTIIRLENERKLPAVRLGAGSVRYRREDVEKFISDCREQ